MDLSTRERAQCMRGATASKVEPRCAVLGRQRPHLSVADVLKEGGHILVARGHKLGCPLRPLLARRCWPLSIHTHLGASPPSLGLLCCAVQGTVSARKHGRSPLVTQDVPIAQLTHQTAWQETKNRTQTNSH